MGVILFELLGNFTTLHERITEIKNLKKTGKPSHEFVQKYEHSAKLVERLVCLEPRQRPDADKIRRLFEFKMWKREVIV